MLPQFLFVCQWNEFAGELLFLLLMVAPFIGFAGTGQANGQGYGPNHDDYVDSYSAELSNDMEPTSLTACAYARPNTVCGGWCVHCCGLLLLLRAATMVSQCIFRCRGFREANLFRAAVDLVRSKQAGGADQFPFALVVSRQLSVPSGL